jgi:hypothetical protein
MFSSRCLAHSSFAGLSFIASTFAYDASSNTNIAMYYVTESYELVFGARMLTAHLRVKDRVRMSLDSVTFATVLLSTLFHLDS